MNNPCLEILFGPIASGKSTYARKRAGDGVLVANDDAIVTAVHGGVYGAYDAALKPLYKSLRSQIIHVGAALGRNVVVDSTGLRRSTRDHLRTLARSLDMDVKLIIFKGGEFHGPSDGARRFAADARGKTREEWVRIGKHHEQTHDPVTPSELANYDSFCNVRWRGWGSNLS